MPGRQHTLPYVALVLTGTSLLCVEVAAQSGDASNKSIQVPRSAVPPVIDGFLDEEVWTRATVVADLHQMDPIEYSQASEKTEFYVFYDKDALYVAARMWDSRPNRAGSPCRHGS